jgi:hypothetical protein
LTLGLVQTALCQDNYSYKDKYGNQIKVSSSPTLPDKIDTVFLKQNLTGLDLNKKLLDSETRYNFIITITSIKPNKKYKVDVVTYPIDGKIETIINNSQGHQVYFMKTKMVGGQLQINQINFDHSEI